jgi:CBS domain-containing protein
MTCHAARRPAGEAASAAWIATVPVRTLMRDPVVTVRAETPVREAAALMRERRIRHLPVLDSSGRITGIVTDRDLRQVVFDAAIRDRLGPPADALADLPVREAMTWAVVTVTPETDVRSAAALMRERRLGALPVVDRAGHVVGILTERDLLHALQKLLAERLVRPRPAIAEPGGEYDPGMPAPPDDDPWRELFALD